MDKFSEVNNVDVSYQVVERRDGDLASVYANASKAAKDLNWEAKRSLADMCRDVWTYEQRK